MIQHCIVAPLRIDSISCPEILLEAPNPLVEHAMSEILRSAAHGCLRSS